MSEVGDPPPDEPTSSGSLSEEYTEMLALLETEFKDRYTETDPNFQTYLKSEGDPPPIVDNFFSRPAHRDGERRNTDHRQGSKRRYDDRRHDGGHRDRYDQRHHHHHQYQEHRSRDDRWSHRDNRGHHNRDQRQWNQQRHSGPDSRWT